MSLDSGIRITKLEYIFAICKYMILGKSLSLTGLLFL